MDQITVARLVMGAIAVVVWGYGSYADNADARLAGMIMLAAVLVLRFLRRRPKSDDAPTE